MDRPHILLITTDQQRFDAAGDAAPAFMRTPHFDHLTREGINFSAAYGDCPICVPSRMSIMTGKYVTTHGMTGNGPSSRVLSGASNTLPTCMNELGYQTAAIGKMHFTPQRARHGFQEMILPEDYYRHMARRGYDVQPMRHGLGQNELYPGLATVPEALTLTSWTAEQCVEFIRERRDPTAPFFLWCSFSKPHPPIDPPEPYYSMYRDCDIPQPVYGDWSEGESVPYAFRLTREKQSYRSRAARDHTRRARRLLRRHHADRLQYGPHLRRSARYGYFQRNACHLYLRSRRIPGRSPRRRQELLPRTICPRAFCLAHAARLGQPPARVAQSVRWSRWPTSLPTAVTAAGGTPPHGCGRPRPCRPGARRQIAPRPYLESQMGGPEPARKYRHYRRPLEIPVVPCWRMRATLRPGKQILRNCAILLALPIASSHLERLRTELIDRHHRTRVSSRWPVAIG